MVYSPALPARSRAGWLDQGTEKPTTHREESQSAVGCQVFELASYTGYGCDEATVAGCESHSCRLSSKLLQASIKTTFLSSILLQIRDSGKYRDHLLHQMPVCLHPLPRSWGLQHVPTDEIQGADGSNS